MTENIKRIRNPLTIIGFFCALAEVGGTIVLPFLLKENQVYYMWFLIVFPILLVACFFLTLNFNSKVLYAPSDFQDENNFLKYLQPKAIGSAIQKTNAEYEESKKDIPDHDNLLFEEAPRIKARARPRVEPTAVKQEPQQVSRERYFFIEELVINKLKIELKTDLSREYELTFGRQKFQFDAVSYKKGRATLIEVKVLLSNLLNKRSLHDTLTKMQLAYDALSHRGVSVQAIIAFAFSLEHEKSAILRERIQNIMQNYHFRPLLKYYDIEALETWADNPIEELPGIEE